MIEDKITSSCKCPRCQGLVVDDILLCEVSYWMGVLRCVNCGWVKLQEKITTYVNREKPKQVDELELYKIRSRGRGRGQVLQMKGN